MNALYAITVDHSTLVSAIAAAQLMSDEFDTTYRTAAEPVRSECRRISDMYRRAAQELRDAMRTAEDTGNTLPLDEEADEYPIQLPLTGRWENGGYQDTPMYSGLN